MERTPNKKIQMTVAVGIMAAMVFALSGVRINIPSPDLKAAVHLGNIMCILSGLLFGSVRGGLSSGIGSMIYDFTNPLYLKDAPFTFINKFMMGFVAGVVNKRLRVKKLYARAVIAAVLGQLTYVILYLTKSFIFDIFFYQNAFETAMINLGTKSVTSLINAAIAVICAVPIYMVLRTALLKTPFVNIIEKN